LTAFGTTSKALKTYSYIDEKLSGYFKGHEILWAYSSRMVKDWIKKTQHRDAASGPGSGKIKSKEK